ncbi:hypothetical protein SARC_01485 [Sphaeroforma arctica JP610]|uniref:SWIM-type domain-containing protein n=1 Tax=Sphaeroforma arctica JP610 TaxID=667725 RepID=A0A0L0GBL1_9EUKA|nr:hypothetical protein SARC_01485 [Sphaeroforma arctica JP610]KNC86390.1 hypothetical protein SARC_01485 [Sphaeroforma arctica JP610]|eukprot:XP_014160292.1 hypothetical protein SARC_01485 [Sphaeroforma arctica JP610]
MDNNTTLEDVAVESDGFHILEEDKSKSSVVDQNQDFESTRETVDDYISLSADSEARSTTGSESETDMFLTDGSIPIEELYEYDNDQNIQRSTSWSELNETSGWQDELPSKELVDQLTHRILRSECCVYISDRDGLEHESYALYLGTVKSNVTFKDEDVFIDAVAAGLKTKLDDPNDIKRGQMQNFLLSVSKDCVMATIQDLRDELVHGRYSVTLKSNGVSVCACLRREALGMICVHGGRTLMTLALDNSREYDKFKEKYNLQDEKWCSPVFHIKTHVKQYSETLQIPNELDIESKGGGYPWFWQQQHQVQPLGHLPQTYQWPMQPPGTDNQQWQAGWLPQNDTYTFPGQIPCQAKTVNGKSLSFHIHTQPALTSRVSNAPHPSTEYNAGES